MRKETDCKILYKSQIAIKESVNDTRPQFSKYFIHHFFGEEGEFSTRKFSKLFQEKYGSSIDYELGVGPFENLVELKDFALAAMQENNIKEASLISVEDYNCALESVRNIDDFHAVFSELGQMIYNEKYSSKSKFLSRIFKD